jgi:uncharacterized protein
MLTDKIKSDLIESMKARDEVRTMVIRMLLSEMNYKRIELQKDLEEGDVVATIQKEVKKRREAIESFTAGGRTEQAAAEQKELEILKKYLPEQMTEEQVAMEIKAIPELAGLTEFGQIMKIVAPRFRGKADGGMVAAVVKKIL